MNNLAEVKKIFESRKMRITSCRLDIVRVFQDSKHAISHSDVENVLGSEYDRVTLYRTLNTFLEKGIIHKVIDDSSNTKYALCTHQHGHDSNHQHSDNHVHFQCVECNNTVCLDELEVPQINIPSGYKKLEVNYLVKGVCKNCTK